MALIAEVPEVYDVAIREPLGWGNTLVIVVTCIRNIELHTSLVVFIIEIVYPRSVRYREYGQDTEERKP